MMYICDSVVRVEKFWLLLLIYFFSIGTRETDIVMSIEERDPLNAYTAIRVITQRIGKIEFMLI